MNAFDLITNLVIAAVGIAGFAHCLKAAVAALFA